jgi:CubicO group peptidase (beta-lactamase class C family)
VGGYRDGATRAPWQRDTIVNVYSTTKGVASLAIAVAASRGLIDYDARVADYWPEFAQAGKGGITVRQLLSHQAGLPALDPVPKLRDVADTERLSAILAAQAPAWPPGTRHGYHAVTLGWYESELIRHADPAGRTLGRYFADEVATPLGLDFYIGLPDSVDRGRVAWVHDWKPAEMLLHLNLMPARFALGLMNPRSLASRSLFVPASISRTGDMANREDCRVVEIPASNGIGTARSVARLYGSAATGGVELGLDATTLGHLTAPPVLPSGGRRDVVLSVDTTFSLGFWKPKPEFQFGSTDRAFGTPGVGGSFVMNRMGFHGWGDPRELALRHALIRDTLGGRPQT